MPGSCPNVPCSMLCSILRRSMFRTRPAPMFICPTSEFPIWPTGNPTSGPWVTNVDEGKFSIRLSKQGVLANETALPSIISDKPHPSKMHKTTGFFFVMMVSTKMFHLLTRIKLCFQLQHCFFTFVFYQILNSMIWTIS